MPLCTKHPPPIRTHTLPAYQPMPDHTVTSPYWYPIHYLPKPNRAQANRQWLRSTQHEASHFYPLPRYNPSPIIPNTQNPTILCALCASAVNPNPSHPSRVLRAFASLRSFLPSPASSSIVRRPSSVVHRPSSIVRRPSPIVHRPSSIVHRPSSIVHRPSSLIRNSPPTMLPLT